MCSHVCGRLSWLAQYSRPIAVHGANVSIISSPQDYFKWLKSEISKASHSIRLSSLYLGTGNHEKELVDTIRVALHEKPHLKCYVILDYLRGNRGCPNSLNMLRLLLETCPTQFHLYMYHTPKLRGVLKRLIPERFNEIVGVQHTKLNLFDDNILMTGANLSEDYFTNRQDRYIAFHSSPELANYLTSLHQIIARHSFVIKPSNDDSGFIINSPLATPTYKLYSSKNEVEFHESSFYKALQSLVQTDKETHADTNTRIHSDTRTHSNTSTPTDTRTHSNTRAHTDTNTHFNTRAQPYASTHTDTRTQFDTFVFPLIQMGLYNIFQDENVTEKLLKTNHKVYLASGYFNLPHKYTKAIMASNGKCTVLASSPQCMGFYGAKGIAGYIPQLYSNLAKQFIKQVVKTRSERVKYMEYYRPEWTYHCKGIWCYEEGETLPLFTLIGSSNYGYRSMTRDLEVQVAMVTQNRDLKDALDKERRGIFDYGKQMNYQDITSSTDHRVALWVRGVTGLFKHYV